LRIVNPMRIGALLAEGTGSTGTDNFKLCVDDQRYVLDVP